ncbi:16017_t:CDS:2 [Rhizophagus irregularis]|nr:16017_t:CDS:2 [Rhizophagus irregularis]
MSSTFYSDLSNNFGRLLNNEIEYNVIIQNSKEHCIGGYFHNNGDKNGKHFTFRIGGMNIVNFVIDEIGVDFCGVRNSEGEVSLEIFRVKKATITNTLKSKDEVSLIHKDQ